MTMKPSSKRKRNQVSSTSTVLPNELLSQIEESDKKSHLHRKARIVSESLPQSRAAKAQMDIQVSLMECRILLQNALTPALQTTTSSSSTINTTDTDTDTASTSSKSTKGVDKLLNQLLKARKKICDLSTSDSEKDDDSDNDNDDEKQQDMDNVEETLETEYTTLKDQWKSVLDRRHAALKLHNSSSNHLNSNKFQVIDQSFWSQVESTLRHELFLQKSNQASTTTTTTNNPDDETSETSSPPIYDDSKTYRHMVQDFIKLRSEHQDGSNDNDNNTAIAQAAAERVRKSNDKRSSSSSSTTQHLGTSTKNDYGATNADRRSSKGRKIRYVVNEKLTNFAFPTPRDSIPTMSEDVLFKSMFGGVVGASGASVSRKY